MGAGAILRGLVNAGTKARLGHVQGLEDAEAARQAQLAQEAKEQEALQARLRQEALLKFQLDAPNRQRQQFDYEQGVRTRDRQTELETASQNRIREIAESGRQSRQNIAARPETEPRPVKPTDGQLKAASYIQRASHEASKLNNFDNVGTLTTIADKGGVWGNWAKSPEGRQLMQAAKAWALAVLRQDSQGTITDTEMEFYFDTYLPRPGDDEVTLTQKRESRRIMEEALHTAAGPAAPAPAWPPAGHPQSQQRPPAKFTRPIP